MKLKKFIKALTEWVDLNFKKIMFVAVVYILFAYLLELPYINVIKTIISYFPFLISYVVVLLLFKPSKELLLKISFYTLIPAFVFTLLRVGKVTEVLGIFIYLLIMTYLLFSLKEFRTKD